MQDQTGEHTPSVLELLDSHVHEVVEKLNNCRKENELLRSEISSLQEILRSCKVPVSTTSRAEASEEEQQQGTRFAYTEKLQIRQKLVMILQKIEMELRKEPLD